MNRLMTAGFILIVVSLLLYFASSFGRASGTLSAIQERVTVEACEKCWAKNQSEFCGDCARGLRCK